MDTWFIYLATLFLVVYRFVAIDARVMEKTELVCNGPCGHMTLTCPSGHQVAIRDAVYRVQEKVDTCTPFTGCGEDATEEVCCEPTPDDCVFSFSPSHLRAAQRNCSHATGCQLQTERSEVESVQCSASDPASQTLVNYVCVNDSAVTDICSPQERVVQGKTLFALLNPHGPNRPHQGSVCTCLAESTKWPTTNSIAAFIVDMRLNRVDSEQCANASMTVRSGSNQKTLTCATSRDPRVNFPFVAVLNDSNVASLRLQLDKHLPEFIWLGFEANEEEDIRLSCKLQGFQPTRPNNGKRPNHNNGGGAEVTPTTTNPPQEQETQKGSKPSEKSMQRNDHKLPLAIIIGAVFAGVAAVIIVIIIVVVIKRRWKNDGGLPVTGESESELDLYYSTASCEHKRRELANNGKRPSKCSTDSRQELYISADQVRANKRNTSSKRVRIVSTPDIVEDLGPELYVSRKQIREIKRKSQKKKQAELERTDSANEISGPPLPSAPRDVGDEEDDDDHYDRLHGPQKNMAAILESYDQLEPSEHSGHRPDYSTAEVRVQRSESTRPLMELSDNIVQSDQGSDNQAYEVTDVRNIKGEPKSLFRITPCASNDMIEDKEVYFELEADRSSRNSTISVASSTSLNPLQQFRSELPPQQPSSTEVSDQPTSSPKETFNNVTAPTESTTLPLRGVSLEGLCKTLSDERITGNEEQDEEEIYNDGRSEFSSIQREKSSVESDSQLSPSSKPKKRTRASVGCIELKGHGAPVAAPRRKPSVMSVPSSANYDLAKPIPLSTSDTQLSDNL